MDYTTVLAKATQTLDQRKDRSAWDKGVTVYALELAEQLADAVRGGYIDADDLMAPRMLRKALLNGADDWSTYSWGGCSLIYNSDIAERLCCPSELKRTRNGARRPNSQISIHAPQQPGRVVRHSGPRTASGG